MGAFKQNLSEIAEESGIPLYICNNFIMPVIFYNIIELILLGDIICNFLTSGFDLVSRPCLLFIEKVAGDHLYSR